MSSEFSAVNFLLELKDFRHLTGGFKPFVKRLKRFASNLTKPEKGKTFEALSQTVLFKEFALDPFIGDIGKIVKGLTTLQKRLRELQKRAGKPQTRHYRYVLPGYEEGPLVYQQVALSYKYWQGIQHTMTSDYARTYHVLPTYHATCRFWYSLDTSGAVSTIDALLDTLGLRKDPSIIWNAIPFTFMVDWFIDVSSFLERFARDNVGVNIAVDDFCSSVKSIVQYDCRLWHWCNVNSPPWGYSGEKVHDASGTLQTYERRTLAPSIASALKTSGLSGREAVLTTALFGAGAFRKRT
jgi:hypothetical protein